MTVLAAASLGDVLQPLASAFERDTGVHIALSTGPSGALRKQIEWGAPADVFVSADAAQVDALERSGKCALGSRRVLAINRLVIAVLRTASATSGGAEGTSVFGRWPSPEVLKGSAMRRIALANPEYAPAGRYAQQAFERLGLWKDLQAKIVFADDVRGAVQHLVGGSVDAAVVYASDVTMARELSAVYVFPPELHDAIEHVGVIISAGKPASEFLEYLAAEKAALTWAQFGFEPAGKSGRGARP